MVFLLNNGTLISYDLDTSEQINLEGFPSSAFGDYIVYPCYNADKTIFAFSNETHLIFYNVETKKLEEIYYLYTIAPDISGISYLASEDVFVVSWFSNFISYYSLQGDYLYDITFPNLNEEITTMVVEPENLDSNWIMFETHSWYYRYYKNGTLIHFKSRNHGEGGISKIYWINQHHRFLFNGRYNTFLYNNDTKKIEYIYEKVSYSYESDIWDYTHIILLMFIVIGIPLLTLTFVTLFIYFIKKE